LSFEKKSKMICYPHYLLASPKNISVYTSTSEYASTADIFTTPTSPYSWFNYIGVHNNPEYASTASISTVMTMPLHVKPFEKKIFKEVIFLLKYQQNPQVLKRQSIEKKREKYSKKEEKGKKRKKKKSSKSLFK
jgi:hypothetical protein